MIDPMRETSRLFYTCTKHGVAAESEERGGVRKAIVDVSGSAGGSRQWRSVMARNGEMWHRISMRGAQ